MIMPFLKGPEGTPPSMKVPPKRKGNRVAVEVERNVKPPSMKVPPKRKGNVQPVAGCNTSHMPSMKVPPKRKGNAENFGFQTALEHPSMKVPPKRKGNPGTDTALSWTSSALNESPSEKEGKSQLMRLIRGFLPGPSMKVPPKRKGNSYPKIARNHAAETGASREPRGGYTQNYTLQPHLPPHNSLAREETMRATRHVPVTYQVLAHTKTPAGCFLSDPARVLTYERG